MTLITTELYLETRACLFRMGYQHEYDWAQTVKTPTSAEDFASEFVWVVLNSGMKNQVAERIAERVYPALRAGQSASTVFGHKGKSAAIDKIWRERSAYFDQFNAAADKVEFCASLPWIGQITKWHLAKNYGADVAKPDRWLVRLADMSGETVDGLCSRLAKATGDRIATVDLVLWRACNLGIWKP